VRVSGDNEVMKTWRLTRLFRVTHADFGLSILLAINSAFCLPPDAKRDENATIA
jgi:hypothetical protein